MRTVAIAVLALGLITSCAATKQAVQDAKAGMSAPLAPGEQSPKEQARNLLEPLSGIPYAGTAVPFAVPIVAWILAWRKGRKERLGLSTSEKPITGALGDAVHLEDVVQHLADVSKGAFELVGAEGSGIRRGWKAIVASLLAGALLHVPALHAGILAHPQTVELAFGAVVALVLALEKDLSKILPVKSS